MAKNGGAGCAPLIVLGLIVVGISRCFGGDDGSTSTPYDSYAASSYPTQPAPTAHRYTQAPSLNCREAPSTSSRRIEALSKGTSVGVIRSTGGWSLLDRSQPCWVSSSFLGTTEPAAPPSRFYSGGGGSERRSGGSTRRSGGAYANCSAARAAGAAPVYAGEPGYGRHLDRDGDGIGCER